MIWFVLWREFKLCTAEVLTVFPSSNIFFQGKDLLVLEWLNKEEALKKADFLWWVIKIFELIKDKNLVDLLFDWLENDWKIKFSVNWYWEKVELKKHIMWVKKALKEEKLSCRFVNKDFKNISSATIKIEKLLEKWADLNLLNLWKKILFWKTFWVQDIDSYSERDFSKKRDMEIWMLPPKLAQIMINLSDKNSLYDPFLWLWTVLIEANLMWIKNLHWSDINPEMIEASKENLWNKASISLLDAKKVWENKDIKKIWTIVSEWYLWEIMTRKDISLERIKEERKKLENIYSRFFSSLQKKWYKWDIVISFPFWDLKWKYVYFDEVYKILKAKCYIEDFNIWNLSPSKMWSLLYKRTNQQVWREIFKLKIKPLR